MSRLSVRATVALAVLLLGVACTGEPNPEPKVRAQKPVKKIDTEFLLENPEVLIERGIPCWPACAHSIGVYHPLPKVYPRRTNAVMARLQEQQPPWLRYIQAVEVSAVWGPRLITVLTGIVVDGPGKEVGRTICDSLLIQPGISAVTVWGVEESPESPMLASCQSPYS